VSDTLVQLLWTLGPAGALIIVILALILNPDKAARWGEILWALIARIWGAADRRAVRLGLESRVNSFSRDIARETGLAHATRARVEWAETDEQPSHFFEDDRLVLRLHAHHHQDRNLVTGSILLVSQTLVRRSKSLLSKRQARSVDLYAVDRLLARAVPARDLFREEVMGPETDRDRDLGELVLCYTRMDRVNLFFPVFVRELNYLGQKVVVRPRDQRVIEDVNGLLRFLDRYSERAIGQRIAMEQKGRILGCAIMIIARTPMRLKGRVGPYMDHLRTLQGRGYETIYLVGSAEPDNAEFMSSVANTFTQQTGWRQVDRRTFRATLQASDGPRRVWNLLITLRTPTPKDVLEELAEVGDLEAAEAGL
jgi:hypothetical protein